MSVISQQSKRDHKNALKAYSKGKSYTKPVPLHRRVRIRRRWGGGGAGTAAGWPGIRIFKK